MKTLEEHNRSVLREKTRIRGNGILCPKCKTGELYDSQPDIMLTSYPPQYPVACLDCDFTGSRY